MITSSSSCTVYMPHHAKIKCSISSRTKQLPISNRNRVLSSFPKCQHSVNASCKQGKSLSFNTEKKYGHVLCILCVSRIQQGNMCPLQTICVLHVKGQLYYHYSKHCPEFKWMLCVLYSSQTMSAHLLHLKKKMVIHALNLTYLKVSITLQSMDFKVKLKTNMCSLPLIFSVLVDQHINTCAGRESNTAFLNSTHLIAGEDVTFLFQEGTLMCDERHFVTVLVKGMQLAFP